MAEDQLEVSPGELRAFAYRLLGRREYSVFELKQRLRQKWAEADGIGQLIDALVEENLLSDHRFAESFVRSRVNRSQGPLKIRAAIRTKGVDDVIVEEAMRDYTDQWIPMAEDWLARNHSGPIDYATKQKLYRRLQNRGFTHDQAMQALQNKQ